MEYEKRNERWVCFGLRPIKDTKRNRILRRLFGRKEKGDLTKGVVEEVNGKKLSPMSFVVSLEKSQDIIKMLSSDKLDFKFFEFWSDEV